MNSLVALIVGVMMHIQTAEEPSAKELPQLPELLSAEIQEAVIKEQESRFSYALVESFQREKASRKTKERKEIAAARQSFIDGDTEFKTRPIKVPKGLIELTEIVRLVDIVDDETVLIKNGFNLDADRIWLTGIDTTNLTDDRQRLSAGFLCVELEPKDYTTLLGDVDRVRQAKVIPDEYFELLWKWHRKTSLTGEKLETMIAAAKTEAAKREKASKATPKQ